MTTPSIWPRRVCLIADRNPYQTVGGASRYLDAVVRALGTMGAETTLLILRPAWRHERRAPEGALGTQAALYRDVRLRGARHAGGWIRAGGLPHVVGRLRRLGQGWTDPEYSRGWMAPIPDAAADWAARQLAELKPDLVIGNYFVTAQAVRRAPAGAATALLLHDVMAQRIASRQAAGASAGVEMDATARETAAFGAVGLCLAIKEDDAVHVRAAAPGARAAVIPMGVEAPEPDADAPRAPVAVLVATRVAANVDGLHWLLDGVWPLVRAARPDARLRIVGALGREVAAAPPDGVEIAGFVEDLAAEYRRASVALSPVRFGSGVKIKLIEALAHGVPVVATPAGAEGVPGAPATALRLAEDAPAFAAALLAALDDPDAPASRRAARAFAARHYGPAATQAALVEALSVLRSAL